MLNPCHCMAMNVHKITPAGHTMCTRCSDPAHAAGCMLHVIRGQGGAALVQECRGGCLPWGVIMMRSAWGEEDQQNPSSCPFCGACRRQHVWLW